MALIGGPRDMKKWSDTLVDPEIRFPGESGAYRRARRRLLDSEEQLRRMNEQVAAQRRALPLGGPLLQDYVFESAGDGGEVRFSQLFAPGKDTLVIYSMMFPRWPEDPRAGAPHGQTALLPLVEQPCPSCTSVVDGLEGAAFHLAERINLVVVAKANAARLGTYAQERDWRTVRLVSSQNNTFNHDYHCETSTGVQIPLLHVFTRDDDAIHHRWTSEQVFARGDSTAMDPIWLIWGALDLTPDGRGEAAAYPSLQY
ncbi:MAG TPA: DUF899 family protein [Pseudonocardia sp.]|jgi:predicted dithiol-disulfide oxidoreductase (DUF899 family)|nr:DUF899 family protein [Pseudonocardia sp.]